MSRPELGHKLCCVGCGVRFYDLNRSPPTCPKCELQQPSPKLRAPRPVRPDSVPARLTRNARQVAAEAEEEPIAEVDADAEEADELVDADDAADDDDVESLPDIGEGAA